MKNTRYILGGFMFLLAVYFVLMINFWNASMNNEANLLAKQRWMYISATILVCYCVMIWFSFHNFILKGIHVVCFLWCLVLPIVQFVNHSIFYHYIITILWPLVFEVSYILCYKYSKTFLYFRRLFVFFALVGGYLFLQTRTDYILKDVAQTNTIYFSLLTIPWLLLIKEGKYKFIILVLFSMLIALSLKRSALLVILFSWGCYIMSFLKGRRNKLFAIVVVLSLLIVGARFYMVTDDALGGRLSERVNREETDEGRNRLAIWNVTTTMIANSSIPELIIGHGHMAVYNDSPLGITAHNDFLEVIYDYGIVTLFLYICLWIYIFKRCVSLYKDKYIYFLPYAVSLSIMIVMSTVGHLLLYASYFNYIVIFWGCIEGILQRNLKTKKYEHTIRYKGIPVKQ